MTYPYVDSTSTMSGNYIPEVWSAKTLVKFYLSTVFGDIANTDYEGEISGKGDKVIIRTVPDIVIRDYEIDQKLQYTKPEGGTVELLIDKGKYYAVPINDVEKVQADIDYVEKWSDDAGKQLSIVIDREILSDVFVDADSDNKGTTAGAISGAYNMGTTGTPLAVTKTNILEVIVDMGSVLSEQNVPEDNRWLVFPTVFCGLIKKSDLKDVSLTGDAKSPLRNGLIGSIDNFKIYRSNNMTFTTDGSYSVANTIAGHKSAITFASQLTKNETLKNPDDFGDLMRGLQVYGYEVIKGEALVHGYFYKG